MPTLELNDGSCIGESVAICRYIEEMYPEPPLMGRDAKEKAFIEMWNRRAELEGYFAAADAVRNSLPIFEGRGVSGVTGGVPQIPALVERGKQSMGRFFDMLDRQLGENRYVAGDALSIADITAFVAIEFGNWAKIEIPETCANVIRWFDEISARPSALV